MFVASVIWAASAALSFALAAVFQQEAAQTTEEDTALSLRLLQALLRRRKWLLGIGLLPAGYGLQAMALANGPVALVQPIVTTELAIAIPIGMWRRHARAGRREWLGIAAGVAVAGLLTLTTSPKVIALYEQSVGGRPKRRSGDRGPAAPVAPAG